MLGKVNVGALFVVFIWRQRVERHLGDNVVETHSPLLFLVDSRAQLPNSRI
jgi:hypothetical protein